MKHAHNINGVNITVEITCGNPALENNTCPTGNGDCTNCHFCKVEMSAKDYFALNPGLWQNPGKTV